MPLDHYIPQVHLKKFYSPALDNRQFYATRKSDLKSFTQTSSNVCRIDNGNTNAYLKEDRVIEEFLKTIEPKYNEAVAKLIEDRIDRECIYTISGFVAYVISCSPAGMRIQSEPLKGTVEMMAARLEAQGLLPPPPKILKELGIDGESFTELLESGGAKVEVDSKYSQAIGMASIRRSLAIFGNYRWDILLNALDCSPFFTSDFPAAIEKTTDPDIVNRIVPLSPNLAIRIKPDRTLDRNRADLSFENFRCRRLKIKHKEVVDVNRLLVRCAEDIVFYRDDSSWVKTFIAKNSRYHVEASTSTQPTSKGSLLISRQQVVEKPA